ncbi:MAG TPA: TrmH family RNA methyltransferase [Candidatus Saccharibacteria bacterium]|nr:TrmH family RNA methyltransferase [Candidatus Saccharibacteria bacterium]
MTPDARNVLDEFKDMPHGDIVAILDARGVELEIGIENLERDYNMGTIVRSANAFGVRHVHIIGRKQWNKRGAMMTDKYLHVHYYDSSSDFVNYIHQNQKKLIAIENNVDSAPLHSVTLPKSSILLFGSEGSGISANLLSFADRIVHIEQLGSTRSLNVGVAAGIAMYDWLRRHEG